jgi:hypothetical protein
VSDAAPFQWLSAQPKRRGKLGLVLGLALVGLVVLWVALGQNEASKPTAHPLRAKPTESQAAKARTEPPAPARDTAASAPIPAKAAEQNSAPAQTGTPRSEPTSELADAHGTRESSRARKTTSGTSRTAQRGASTRLGKSAQAESEKELRQLFAPAAEAAGPAVPRPAADEPPVANEAHIFD